MRTDPSRSLPDPRKYPADRSNPAQQLAEETRPPESAKMAEKALIAPNSQHTVLPTQTTGSLMPRSPPCFGRTKAPMFCTPCLGSAPSSRQLSSLTSVATWTHSAQSTGSPASRAWRQSYATPDESAGICIDHARFNRRLLRTCYLVAALSSLKNSPASRTFYDRKRGEGKSHKQALIACPAPHQRPLGHAPRPHHLPGTNASDQRSNCLTEALRFPISGNGPVIGLRRAFADQQLLGHPGLPHPGPPVWLAHRTAAESSALSPPRPWV